MMRSWLKTALNSVQEGTSSSTYIKKAEESLKSDVRCVYTVVYRVTILKKLKSLVT